MSSISRSFTQLPLYSNTLSSNDEKTLQPSPLSAFTMIKRSGDHSLTEIQSENVVPVISDSHLYNLFPGMEGRESKKLSSQTYYHLFEFTMDEISHGRKPHFVLSEHPKISNLDDLPGKIYFLKVHKGSRRPPHIGHSFRSYSDCHYSTINREKPIICKVKVFLLYLHIINLN